MASVTTKILKNRSLDENVVYTVNFREVSELLWQLFSVDRTSIWLGKKTVNVNSAEVVKAESSNNKRKRISDISRFKCIWCL